MEDRGLTAELGAELLKAKGRYLFGGTGPAARAFEGSPAVAQQGQRICVSYFPASRYRLTTGKPVQHNILGVIDMLQRVAHRTFGALLAVGLLLMAPGAAVGAPENIDSTAVGSTSTSEQSANACVLFYTAHVHGREVRLWSCASGRYHGEIANGSYRDTVWLQTYFGGQFHTCCTGEVPSGSTSGSTTDSRGGGWYACGKAFNRPETACTSAGIG